MDYAFIIRYNQIVFITKMRNKLIVNPVIF